MTKVVHCKRDIYDIYIGRPSKWGNPYTHIKDKNTKAEYIVSTRKESIEKYKEYILNTPELLNSLYELKDKVLGCWCKPNKKCHGDILVELIEIYCSNTIKNSLF
jgi:hypothetical protein